MLKNTKKPDNKGGVMYQDPRLIKKHEVKIRLDDNINELLNSFFNVSGGQKSVVVRDILIKGLLELKKHNHSKQEELTN
jgi:hypothetical protein